MLFARRSCLFPEILVIGKITKTFGLEVTINAFAAKYPNGAAETVSVGSLPTAKGNSYGF